MKRLGGEMASKPAVVVTLASAVRGPKIMGTDGPWRRVNDGRWGMATRTALARGYMGALGHHLGGPDIDRVQKKMG